MSQPPQSFSFTKINLAMVLIASLILTACSHQATPAPTTGAGSNGTSTVPAGQTDGAPAADQKRGDTVVTGSISKSGTIFFLTEAGKQPRVIESYAVNLDDYVGQTVTLTGQYSGDTLFVGSVQ